MHKVFKIMSILCCTALAVGTVHANSQPTTFVGPTLAASYSGWYTPTSAYSILGEAGPRNYRINLTAGSKIDDVSRIKFGAEYLWQNITYAYRTGQVSAWMEQVAIGLDYEYFVGCNKDHSIELGGYGAYAPSRDFGTQSGFVRTFYTPTDFLLQPITDDRRAAGANSYGAIGGVNFYLWSGSKWSVYADYDNVSYRSVHGSDAQGFGATVKYQQLFGDHLRSNLLGELRRPYANYRADLHWDNFDWYGRWGFGVFGSYVYGRTLLPTTWNTGVDIQYFADCTPAPRRVMDYKNENQACYGTNQPYVVIPAPGANPVVVSTRPPELGPRLPVSRVGFYNTNRVTKHNGRKSS